MTKNGHSLEEYGEFKGSTSAKLEIIFIEIKGLRKDVDSLKQWKAWAMGLGAAAGFIAGIAERFVIK